MMKQMCVVVHALLHPYTVGWKLFDVAHIEGKFPILPQLLTYTLAHNKYA